MADKSPDQNARHPYSVKLVNEVEEFIIQNVWSERVYDKIKNYLDLLAYFPDLGTPHLPEYPAARTPFPCRFVAVPDTPFTLYYITLEDERAVVVIYIENQASDPKERFSWEIISF